MIYFLYACNLCISIDQSCHKYSNYVNVDFMIFLIFYFAVSFFSSFRLVFIFFFYCLFFIFYFLSFPVLPACSVSLAMKYTQQ